MTRVCRRCGTIAPDPRAEPICPDVLGVGAHSYVDVEAEAYELGKQAAEAAASWALDGNTPVEHVVRVVEMMDAGDPELDVYLPARPDLSGEWGDEPTQQSVAEAVLFEEALTPELVDEIATAWERGVNETFEQAVEAEFRRQLPEEEVSSDGAA